MVGLSEGCLEPNLPTETTNGIGVDKEVVAFRDRIFRQCGESVKRIQYVRDCGRAIERRAMPRPRKVAPFGQRPPRATKAVDRSVAIAGAAEDRRARSPQGSSKTFGWTRQRLLQPCLKCARIEL